MYRYRIEHQPSRVVTYTRPWGFVSSAMVDLQGVAASIQLISRGMSSVVGVRTDGECMVIAFDATLEEVEPGEGKKA